jgi:hypothetical protein
VNVVFDLTEGCSEPEATEPALADSAFGTVRRETAINKQAKTPVLARILAFIGISSVPVREWIPSQAWG